MRWRKHKVKQLEKIVKKFYSKKSDPMMVMLRDSVGVRKYPECLTNSIGRMNNRYYVNDYASAETSFFGNRVSVPSYVHSKVKRSRVQGVLHGYLLITMEELNKELGTNYTQGCLDNIKFIKDLDEELDDDTM